MASLQTVSAVCSIMFGLPGGIYASIQLHQHWKINDPKRKMLRVGKVIGIATLLIFAVASLTTGIVLLVHKTPPATLAITPSFLSHPEPPKLQPENSQTQPSHGSQKSSDRPKKTKSAEPPPSVAAIPNSSPPVVVNAENNQGNVAGINYGTQNTFRSGRPLPHIVHFATEVVPAQSGPTLESQWQLNPGLKLYFRVDSVFANPYFLVHCDKPCRATNIMFERGSYTSGGWSGTPPFFRTSDPKTVGVGGGDKTVVYPFEEIVITVRAMDSSRLDSAIVEASEQ